jgi:hypothetical protein
MTLPTFLGIGTVKGGSSSMYYYLKAHPMIFMSEPKELQFFVAELNWDRGLEWYERHFAGAEAFAAAGEFSPGYTQHPHLSGVPKRIASVLPDVRLVYFVRDPIERMRSHYQARVLSRRERASGNGTTRRPTLPRLQPVAGEFLIGDDEQPFEWKEDQRHRGQTGLAGTWQVASASSRLSDRRRLPATPSQGRHPRCDTLQGREPQRRRLSRAAGRTRSPTA